VEKSWFVREKIIFFNKYSNESPHSHLVSESTGLILRAACVLIQILNATTVIIGRSLTDRPFSSF